MFSRNCYSKLALQSRIKGHNLEVSPAPEMVPVCQRLVLEQMASDAAAVVAVAAAAAVVVAAAVLLLVWQAQLMPVMWDVFCPLERACC